MARERLIVSIVAMMFLRPWSLAPCPDSLQGYKIVTSFRKDLPNLINLGQSTIPVKSTKLTHLISNSRNSSEQKCFTYVVF